VLDVVRAFFVRNKAGSQGGKYEDIIERLQKTGDLDFEIK